MAILCRNYGVRTNLQTEIATASVRTGLTMTKRVVEIYCCGMTAKKVSSSVPLFFIVWVLPLGQ